MNLQSEKLIKKSSEDMQHKTDHMIVISNISIFSYFKFNIFLGLQKRIEALVLHHFKLQDCNEGVTSHTMKMRKEHMTNNLIYCPSCQKLKPIEAFTIHAR